MKLSIIIPCYNCEKYVARCLNSILNQNYKNIEVIAVNDGSIDDTEAVIKEIMATDSRLQYLQKENSGVSDTRNMGMQMATGDLLTFVDSDDEVCPEMYETLIDIMSSESADIVHCSYTRIDQNGAKYVGNTKQAFIHNRLEGMGHLLQGDLFTAAVWNKIYKTELLKTIRFDNRFKINEDVLFNYHAFKNATKSVYFDSCFYNYHVEETSVCKNTGKVKNAEDCYFVSEIMSEDSQEAEYKELAAVRFLNNKLNLYRVYKNYAQAGNKEKIKKLKHSIKNDLKRLHLGKQQKISAVLIVYMGGLYVFLYNIYDKLRRPNWDV